jgi:ribosomal-protein-alanine N-acetyltransferase
MFFKKFSIFTTFALFASANQHTSHIDDHNQLFTQIKTDRLIIQTYQPTDFSHFQTLFQNPEVMKLFAYGRPFNNDEINLFINDNLLNFNNIKILPFFSVFKNDQSHEFIGTVFLYSGKNGGEGEIGYAFSPSANGNGYCFEATKALMDTYAPWIIQSGYTIYQNEPLQSIVATVHPDNKGSIRILEKLGLTYETQFERYGNPRLFYRKVIKS